MSGIYSRVRFPPPPVFIGKIGSSKPKKWPSENESENKSWDITVVWHCAPVSREFRMSPLTQAEFDRLATFVAVAEELSMEPFVSDDNHERLVQIERINYRFRRK